MMIALPRKEIGSGYSTGSSLLVLSAIQPVWLFFQAYLKILSHSVLVPDPEILP